MIRIPKRFFDDHRERDAKREADRRVRDEAHALLAALRDLVIELGAVHRSDRFSSADDALNNARAILARIDGKD